MSYFEMKTIEYPRMSSGYDQHGWVRAAAEQAPTLRDIAAQAQQTAAIMFATREAGYLWVTQEAISDAYNDARQALQRLLYYEGMGRANEKRRSR